MGVTAAETRIAAVVSRCVTALAHDPLFLDTETTGLGVTDQVVDLAVIDRTGKVLFDSLVRPTIPMPPEVSAVNGITPEMLESAPTFAEIMPVLAPIVSDRRVITYGAGFDVKMIRQTANAWRIPTPVPGAFCAMIAYAEFHGEKSAWGQWKWQKLEAAARQCRIEVPEKLHRALADTELLRRLFLHMTSHGPGSRR
jgi:DNA polymerase-3 subunit epsilon